MPCAARHARCHPLSPRFIVILPTTQERLTFAMVLTLFWTSLLAYLQPMEEQGDNALEAFANVTLMLALYIAQLAYSGALDGGDGDVDGGVELSIAMPVLLVVMLMFAALQSLLVVPWLRAVKQHGECCTWRVLKTAGEEAVFDRKIKFAVKQSAEAEAGLTHVNPVVAMRRLSSKRGGEGVNGGSGGGVGGGDARPVDRSRAERAAAAMAGANGSSSASGGGVSGRRGSAAKAAARRASARPHRASTTSAATT